MKKIDSTTAESMHVDKHVQTKKKVECQHFSIRGYAADMRQKNPTVGSPFAKIADTRWQHIRPTLDTPHSRCWDCANCVREIGTSGISTNLPDLRENSRTLNGDKNSLLICPSDPEKDSSFEHTVAKVMEENFELLPNHPPTEQIQHNVMNGSPNDIYKTDAPRKVKTHSKKKRSIPNPTTLRLEKASEKTKSLQLVELPGPSSSTPQSMKRKLISMNQQKRMSKKRKRVHSKMPPNNDEGIKLLKRGCVTMHRIVKRKKMGTKHTVSFNAEGEAFGPEAVKMQSYIGVLARTRAPIWHDSWKQVTKETKNEIWDYVQMAFVVPPTAKTMVLNSACQKWREFKSRLTRKYVLPYREHFEKLMHPPADYSFIKKSHWDKFVANRVSNKYLKIHKKQKTRGRKNLYPHRSSRRGYANITNEWSKSHPEVKMDRSTAWIIARKDKDGNFKSEEVKKKAEEIEKMKQQVSEGSVVEEGTHDVLTMVLGNPEHPGRVRGQGSHVKQSVYFNLRKQKKVVSIDDKIREGVQKVWTEEASKIIKERDAFWLAEVEKLKKEIIANTLGHEAS